MDFEKKYWSDGEFKQETGEKYFGYVGIYDGAAYIFDTEEKLIADNTFITTINLSENFFDRILSHKLELPYKREDVTFAANDFLYAGTVKTIIERLQENNLYLFKNAIITNSILPVNNTISMFATEDKNSYFLCYIDESGEVQEAPSDSIFKEGKIWRIIDKILTPIGECAYVINESYVGSVIQEVKYTGKIADIEEAEDLYNKFYKIKNKDFSRIPKINVYNKIESGNLKRYSFSDKGLSAKTHIDPYFYPQLEYVDYMSAKSVTGAWEETLSSQTAMLENNERDPECERWDDFDISEDNIRNVYNIVNDIQIDIDDENVESIKEDLEDFQAYGAEHVFLKSSRYYDKLSGIFSIKKFLPTADISTRTINVTERDIIAIWEDLLRVYPAGDVNGAMENFNLRLDRISFLIYKEDNEEFPIINVEGNAPTSIGHIKTSDNFYHVTYYFENGIPVKLIDNNWQISFNFDKSFISVFNEDALKYTISFSYGTLIPGAVGGVDLRNYKRVPMVERKRNFTWVWYKGAEETEENLVIETLPTLTYKYLTESPDWINSEGSHLKYDNDITGNSNKLMSFIPSEDMTAEDCYIYMTNNILSYRKFPYIERETQYNYITLNNIANNNIKSVDDIRFIENPHYKTKNYNIETFKIVEENDIFYIVSGYKNANEAYRELNEENGKNNKKYFDYIPEFKSFTRSESKTTPVHDFTKLRNAEMHIIKRSEDKKYVDILLFLMFDTKILITKVKHFIDENNNFKEDFNIDLRGPSGEHYIEINCVDPNNKNSLLFKKLTDIKVHKNMLYVADGGLNMVMRYDIEYLISPEEDKAFNIKSIELLDVLQGDGEVKDKIYFNNPFAIAASDDRVYIVDRGNKCVKVYSPSLNYIKILKNGYYANHDIQAIAVNPYPVTLEDKTKVNRDSLWIFSVDGARLFLSIIDNDSVVSYGKIEDIILKDDKYSWNEEIKNIEFSKCNSNTYYIATTKRVYKLQTSKPYSPIGSLSYFKQRSLLSSMVWGRMHYRWSKLPRIYSSFKNGNAEDNEVTWAYKPPMSSAEILDNRCFTLCGLDGVNDQFNGDIIFHLGTFYDDNKIRQYIKANNYKFNGNMRFDDIPVADLVPMIKSFNMLFYIEPDSYISSLNNNLINIYDTKLDEIVFEDYINALTFNKMIYSAVHNLLTIKNQIVGNFKAATNIDGLIVYDNMMLDDYFAKLEFDKESNYFIHDNEVISIVANRVFENIHDIQRKILDKMQTKFMAAQAFVNNTSRII